MFCNRPVDTATSAEFLNAPVANALGAPSKMATSGMPMPALSAKRRTVSTIQASSAVCGWLITRAPVLNLAMGLLISNEMMAPPKPMTSENPASAVMFRPLAVRKRSTPRMRVVTSNTAITAKLVRTNSRMRFMGTPRNVKDNGMISGAGCTVLQAALPSGTPLVQTWGSKNRRSHALISFKKLSCSSALTAR